MTSAPSPPHPAKQKYFDPHDDIQYPFGFDQPVHISSRMKKPIELFEYWAAVAYDPTTQKFVSRVSPSLSHDKNEILSQITPTFRSYIENLPSRELVGYPSDLRREIIRQACQDQSILSSDHRGKKTSQNHDRSRKKQKLSTNQRFEDTVERQEVVTKDNPEPHAEEPERKILSYRVDAKESWEHWFSEAFRAVQQVSCRVIAKEWIKTIHPKKQSTNPYNGKISGSRDRGNSELTKPPYWPADVIHKEPDHINKEQRTRLLVHLLMSTPHLEVSPSGDANFEKEINARMLKESLDKKSDELRAKWPIIEHIIHIRTQLEMYEDGGLDGSTVLHVPNYSEVTRNNSTKADDALDDGRDDSDPTKTSDAETSTTTDQGKTLLKQEQDMLSSVPYQESLSSRNSSTYQKTTIGETSQGFPIFPSDQRSGLRTSPLQRNLNQDCDRESGDQVMDIDEIPPQNTDGGHKTKNGSRSSAQAYLPRDFGTDAFDMQYQHWQHQNLNLHTSYPQENMLTQTPVDLIEHDTVLDHLYSPSLSQPGMYYGMPIYSNHAQHAEGHNRSMHKSLSNQFENYMPQEPHGRVMMEQQYYPM